MAQRSRGRFVSQSELESLGKTAARLSATSGISLTEASVRTLEHEDLNAEQIRRAVEQANINAVNAKFASLQGVNRIVEIDGGPADPMTVIDALNASATAPGAQIMAAEYATAPAYEKRAGLSSTMTYDPDLPGLERKLAHAHDELVDMATALEFRMETAFDDFKEAAKMAARDGACLADLAFVWSGIDNVMAKVAAQQLGETIRWGVKTAGRRVMPSHPSVTKFASFAKLASEYHRAVQARQNVELELSRVQRFRGQQVS